MLGAPLGVRGSQVPSEALGVGMVPRVLLGVRECPLELGVLGDSGILSELGVLWVWGVRG